MVPKKVVIRWAHLFITIVFLFLIVCVGFFISTETDLFKTPLTTQGVVFKGWTEKQEIIFYLRSVDNSSYLFPVNTKKIPNHMLCADKTMNCYEYEKVRVVGMVLKENKKVYLDEGKQTSIIIPVIEVRDMKIIND